MHTENNALIKFYTFVEHDAHYITVKACNFKSCIKKLKRYTDDMYETKGYQLLKTDITSESVTFNFINRDITFKFIGVKTI
jgi:hypothetical protein